MKVLVTGAGGFIGSNLAVVLGGRPDVDLFRYDLDSRPEALGEALAVADMVFHLAGVNRPRHPDEFERGNTGSTVQVCGMLAAAGRRVAIVLASSIHADGDTPYGSSKRGAEEAVRRYCEATGSAGTVYRFKNVFGKWCRPHYNSVTATFCHNIARNLPIDISDPDTTVDLTHVDDVVRALVGEMEHAGAQTGARAGGFRFADPLPSENVTLGALAGLIQSFRESRRTLRVPDLSTPFLRALYGTYLTYLPPDDFSYALDVRTDDRGGLAEVLKSEAGGQIFVSRTHAGVTRGHHYHHTKAEKFLVLEGQAVIRFRHIVSGHRVEYAVGGHDLRVVDIPPGYTHSIENAGPGDLLTLFWASEIFDPGRPDTQPLKVQPEDETP